MQDSIFLFWQMLFERGRELGKGMEGYRGRGGRIGCLSSFDHQQKKGNATNPLCQTISTTTFTGRMGFTERFHQHTVPGTGSVTRRPWCRLRSRILWRSESDVEGRVLFSFLEWMEETTRESAKNCDTKAPSFYICCFDRTLYGFVSLLYMKPCLTGISNAFDGEMLTWCALQRVETNCAGLLIRRRPRQFRLHLFLLMHCLG